MAGVLQPRFPCPLPCPKAPFPREGAHSSSFCAPGPFLPSWVNVTSCHAAQFPHFPGQKGPVLSGVPMSSHTPVLTPLPALPWTGRFVKGRDSLFQPAPSHHTMQSPHSKFVDRISFQTNYQSSQGHNWLIFVSPFKKKFSLLSFCKLLWSNGVPQLHAIGTKQINKHTGMPPR